MLYRFPPAADIETIVMPPITRADARMARGRCPTGPSVTQGVAIFLFWRASVRDPPRNPLQESYLVLFRRSGAFADQASKA